MIEVGLGFVIGIVILITLAFVGAHILENSKYEAAQIKKKAEIDAENLLYMVKKDAKQKAEEDAVWIVNEGKETALIIVNKAKEEAEFIRSLAEGERSVIKEEIRKEHEEAEKRIESLAAKSLEKENLLINVSVEEDARKKASEEAEKIIEEAMSEAYEIRKKADSILKESESKSDFLLKDAIHSADSIRNKAREEADEIIEEGKAKAKEKEAELNKRWEAYEERIRIDKENLTDMEDARFAYAGESLQEYRTRLTQYCKVPEWENKVYSRIKEWYPDSSELECQKELLKKLKERNNLNRTFFSFIQMKDEPTTWEQFHGLPKEKKLVLSLRVLSESYFWDKFEFLRDNVNRIGLRTAERILNGVLYSLEDKNLIIEVEKIQTCFEELRVRTEIARLTKEAQEAVKEMKEQQKEEARAQREFEREMKKAREDEVKALAALAKAKAEAEKEKEDKEKFARLQEKIAGLEEALQEAIKRGERAQSMAQLTRHGTVYVISNIGSFGEGVYKIGLTRRLEPLERVHELGDASVPFPFDVHALIESDDAPALETALHQAFADKKLNIINGRKEFFRVSLDEVKEKVKELGYETEWVDVPVAPQFRDSEYFRKKINR